jgi:hypothetical protein
MALCNPGKELRSRGRVKKLGKYGGDIGEYELGKTGYLKN